jgi:hypothetical protein
MGIMMKDYNADLTYELEMLRALEGKPVLRAEDEAFIADLRKAMATLAGTMSEEHFQLVLAEYRSIMPGDLTLRFKELAWRHALGDQRPLVLPPEVARVYLLKGQPGLRFIRECLACGYDVPEFSKRLPDVYFPVCPICGGDYEPIAPGHGVSFSQSYKGWSRANPDKSVDVYAGPNGRVSYDRNLRKRTGL